MTTIQGLANEQLDRVYAQTAGPALEQIQQMLNAPSGRLQRALASLEERAALLAEQGEVMQPDDPTLQFALAEYAAVMDATEQIIMANDTAVQQGGAGIAPMVVTASIFYLLTNNLMQSGRNPLAPASLRYFQQEIAASGLNYTTLSTDALSNAIRYTRSEAWITRMNGWGDGYANLAREQVLNGLRQGMNPRAVAAQFRQTATNVPRYAADNIMRTLQLTAYRDAEVAQAMANRDILVKKIRIAAMDARTCLSCIALHGTELGLDERVDDHYNGRCTAIYQVAGQPPPNVQSGSDWFASLSPERQQQQAGFATNPANWRAFQDGVPLSSFSGEHHDPVFGRQTVQVSLTQAVGQEQAATYYTRNQPHE